MLFLTAVGLMLYGFCGMFGRLRHVFSDPLEDMSFGWLVPVFSLYVLWTSRKDLKESAGRPSILGLLACLPCAAVALLGTRGLQVRMEQVGFVGLCIALPWAFFGWRTAKQCFFPAIFLLFTIPLATFLDSVTIHLRLLASGTAFAVLKGFGVEVTQMGTAIIAQGAHSFNIDVAEPCSGLRSLFALMALTAAYSWYTQPTWLRRIVLFACAIPLAVLGNVVRILTICLFAAWTSADFAMGFYHDYSGYVIFIVAIALMVACGEIVSRLAESWASTHGAKAKKRSNDDDGGSAFKNLSCVKDIKDSGSSRISSDSSSSSGSRNSSGSSSSRFSSNSRFSIDSSDTKAPKAAKSPRTWLAVVALVVLAPIFVFQALTPMTVITEPPEFSLPDKIPGYIAEEVLYCANEQCARMWPASSLAGSTACPVCGGELSSQSLGERTVLPKDTRIMKRIYQRPADGVRFLVSAVIGGQSKSSLHRPELCMPAQGYTMSDPRTFEVAGRPFHAIHLRGGGSPSVLAYTFFNQEGVKTASHTRRIFIDTWDRSVHNRIDRWVMVTVNASTPYDSLGFDLLHDSDRLMLEEFLARLSETLP